MVVKTSIAADICTMKFKTEIIYIKAKELRELINEALNSSAYEDSYLREKLQKLSRQIPFQIGLSLNVNSYECTCFHLEKAGKKLRGLQIAVDLCTLEYFNIDSQKLDSVVEEILELISITLEKAEVDEENRMEEILSEFFVKNETSF